jgi:60 kDa SS-A/Ro ribonucleoprotein
MVNTTLFASAATALPPANAINFTRAPAYRLSPKHALAQLAVTGCLNATFYANAQTQLDAVCELASKVDTRFIAQTALYCRERGYMKDMPALLTALLASRGAPELPAVFERVIDNGRMLRNFVQIIRSGALGRKSLGTRPKKLVQAWLNNASEKALLAAAVGSTPSLADIVKMVHPRPAQAWREAFFAWLIGKPYDADVLPPDTKAFEAYKRDRTLALPDVPFQMLTALDLRADDWTRIALRGGWHMVRMNLNTFARHGVFGSPGIAESIAARLRDADAIARARVFPYQLLSAWRAGTPDIPATIRDALPDALDIALENVPAINGQVVVCPNVSGSMGAPVTGYRASASTAVRCIDVAALIAAAVLRKNGNAVVLPFENQVVHVELNARDSVMTNAQRLAAIGGGGTNCSAPLAWLNERKAKADLVVLVSDNESWIDATRHGATATMRQWEIFRARNPNAKLLCIDIAPHATTQAAERDDVLNVGGFSDDVFTIMAAFASGQMSAAHWIGEIESIDVEIKR